MARIISGVANHWVCTGSSVSSYPWCLKFSRISCISLTPSVLNEALSSTPPTSCIIAYHPPIFKPTPSLTLSNPLQSSLLRCAAAGISIYSPHTALDSVNGGIHDWLASGLLVPDEGKVKILEKRARELGGDVTSSVDGLGRIVEFTKPENGIVIELLVDRVKSFLKLKHGATWWFIESIREGSTQF